MRHAAAPITYSAYPYLTTQPACCYPRLTNPPTKLPTSKNTMYVPRCYLVYPYLAHTTHAKTTHTPPACPKLMQTKLLCNALQSLFMSAQRDARIKPLCSATLSL
jgi:hypothetical protein